MADWFFLHLPIFWLKTRYEKHDICRYSMNLVWKHVYKKIVHSCHNLKHVFLKKSMFFLHQKYINIVWFHFLTWFQKKCHFPIFQTKILYFWISKVLWNNHRYLTVFYKILWGKFIHFIINEWFHNQNLAEKWLWWWF